MIYFFDNYSSLDVENLKSFLPKKRAEKLEKLKQKRDKENCLASYLLLKIALKDFGINSFIVDEDENGKPFLRGNECYFNISHCKCGIAVAVSKFPVGIDIQDVVPYKSGVAKRVFSEAEIAFVKASVNPDREFTRLWTLKEAAVKCDGRGIKILNDFSFENCEEKFEKYDKKFFTTAKENLYISVCGSEDFSEIKTIKNLEDF